MVYQGPSLVRNMVITPIVSFRETLEFNSLTYVKPEKWRTRQDSNL